MARQHQGPWCHVAKKPDRRFERPCIQGYRNRLPFLKSQSACVLNVHRQTGLSCDLLDDLRILRQLFATEDSINKEQLELSRPIRDWGLIQDDRGRFIIGTIGKAPEVVDGIGHALQPGKKGMLLCCPSQWMIDMPN